FFGFLSDFIDRKKMILIGAILTIVCGYFLFKVLLFNIKTLFLFAVGLGLVVSIVNGCYACLIAELFPPSIRYSGMAISYNTAFALFGGLAPLLMTELWRWTNSSLAPYLFLFICCIITIFAVASIKKFVHN